MRAQTGSIKMLKLLELLNDPKLVTFFQNKPRAVTSKSGRAEIVLRRIERQEHIFRWWTSQSTESFVKNVSYKSFFRISFLMQLYLFNNLAVIRTIRNADFSAHFANFLLFEYFKTGRKWWKLFVECYSDSTFLSNFQHRGETLHRNTCVNGILVKKSTEYN